MLGTPPPPNLISIALVIYCFSAIVMILSRMMSGSGKYGGIRHVAYLLAFYGFYHFAQALAENFWAVFAAGATILGLESYHLWAHCSESIRKEEEILSRLEKTPPQP